MAAAAASAKGSYDPLGRVAQVLGPAHYATFDFAGVSTSEKIRSATWTFYGDALHTTWTAQGYAEFDSSTQAWDEFTLFGPVSITKTNRDGHVTDQIEAMYYHNGSLDTSLTDLKADIAAYVGGGADPFPEWLTSTPQPLSPYVAWTTDQYSHTHLVSTRV